MRYLIAIAVVVVVGAIGGCGSSSTCTTSVKKNCPNAYAYNPTPCPDSVCDRDAIRCAVCYVGAAPDPTYQACYINATDGNMYYCVSPN